MNQNRFLRFNVSEFVKHNRSKFYKECSLYNSFIRFLFLVYIYFCLFLFNKSDINSSLVKYRAHIFWNLRRRVNQQAYETLLCCLTQHCRSLFYVIDDMHSI